METQIIKAPVALPNIKTEVLTASEIKAQVALIQQVMKSVMLDGVHYGKIPGCGDKPALLKAGAEKILSTFRIAVTPEVFDLSNSDEMRYRVVAKGVHAPSGMDLGSGVGEASSNEEKYKWKTAVNDQEFDSTPEDRRRSKWK